MIPLPLSALLSCSPVTITGMNYLIVSFGGGAEHVWLGTFYFAAASPRDVNCTGLFNPAKGLLLFNAPRGGQ